MPQVHLNKLIMMGKFRLTHIPVGLQLNQLPTHMANMHQVQVQIPRLDILVAGIWLNLKFDFKFVTDIRTLHLSHIPVPAIGFQSPAQVTQNLGSQPPTHSSHPQTIAFSTPDPPDHGKGKTRATASISTRRKLEDAAKEAMRKRKRQQEEAYRKRIRAKHPDRLCTICDQYIPAPTGKKPSMSQHINVNHPSHLRSTINEFVYLSHHLVFMTDLVFSAQKLAKIATKGLRR